MIRWNQRWEALIPRKPNVSLYCYAVVLVTQTTFSSTGNWVTTTLAIQIPPHNSLSGSPHQQETNLWQTKCIIPFQSHIARLDSYLWEFLVIQRTNWEQPLFQKHSSDYQQFGWSKWSQPLTSPALMKKRFWWLTSTRSSRTWISFDVLTFQTLVFTFSHLFFFFSLFL